MNNSYRIYITTDRIEYIGTVYAKDEVVEVLNGLDVENFIVIEHDNEKRCDNIITYDIKKILEENNVSRGITKVYKRKKS